MTHFVDYHDQFNSSMTSFPQSPEAPGPYIASTRYIQTFEYWLMTLKEEGWNLQKETWKGGGGLPFLDTCRPCSWNLGSAAGPSFKH
jgi:hypothetical protein